MTYATAHALGGWYRSPGDIRGYADSTNNFVDTWWSDVASQFGQSTDSNKQQFLHSAAVWARRWRAYYQDLGWWDYQWGSTYDAVSQWVDELRSWRRRFVNAGGHTESPEPPNPHLTPEGETDYVRIVVIGGVAVGSLMVLYATWPLLRGAHLLGKKAVTRNPRRKRLRRRTSRRAR